MPDGERLTLDKYGGVALLNLILRDGKIDADEYVPFKDSDSIQENPLFKSRYFVEGQFEDE